MPKDEEFQKALEKFTALTEKKGIKTNVNVKTRIKFDGKEYENVEDLPPEVRGKVRAAMEGRDVQKPAPPQLRLANPGFFQGVVDWFKQWF
jgi:hypothetical protein